MTGEPQDHSARAAASARGAHQGDLRALRLIVKAEAYTGVRADAPPTRGLLVSGGAARRPEAAHLLANLPAVGPDSVLVTELTGGSKRWLGGWPVSRRGGQTLPRADVVMLPTLRDSRIRVRAFYAEVPATSSSTLVVHERGRSRRPGRLLTGTAVMEQLRPVAALVIPRLYQQGARSGIEWALEELLPGRPHFRPGLDATAVELAAAMLETWARLGTDQLAVTQYLPAEVLLPVLELLQSQPAGLQGDGARLAERLRRLAGSDLELTTSLCHGDAVLGNTLRLPDGRLALIDWELAGVHPVAADLAKILIAVADRQPLFDQLDDSNARRVFSADWRPQVVFALARWLSGWRSQQDTARRSGRDSAYRRRLAKRVSLLEDLL